MNDKTSPVEKLTFSIPELAHWSGVGRTRIYAEITAGRLRVRKCGRRSLILRSDALEWLTNLPANV